MIRKSSTVLIGSAVLGIIMLLMIYMGLIVTGVIDTRPSSLVIVAESAAKEYDGEPLECHSYVIKSGKLQKGHSIKATYDASQTAVGSCENTVNIKIVDSIGADVTNHYRLETRSGTLTVSPRKLVLRSSDAQKVYDGTPLSYEDWDLSVGKLPEGFSINAIFSGVQMIPGTSKNTFAITVQDANGQPADQNFSISYIYGTLTVAKRPLTVTSYGASKIYDGTELRYEEYTVDGEVLPEHSLQVTFPARITEVGTATNNIMVNVLSTYADVTPYYDITVRVGTLEIKPRPIEISASPCIKYFSGDTLPTGKWYLTKGSLVEGHELYADVEAVKNDEDTVEFLLRNVEVRSSGFPVTRNYDITLVHGIDRDEMEKLVFVSGSKSAPYTGDPLICEQYELQSGKLAFGHRIEATFTGSQTEIGFSDNTFSVTVIDAVTGEDVSYRYNIEYEFGTLQVYENAPTTGGEICDDGSLDNNTQNPDANAARIWAESGGRVYLRWKSYGSYGYRAQSDNWGWGEAMAWPSASENMLYSVGQALAIGGKTPVMYNIEILGNQYLLPNYPAQGPEGAYNDVVLAPSAMSYTLYGYDWTYSYLSVAEYVLAGWNNEQMRVYAKYVQSQYLDVPESTKQALLTLAEEHGLAADRPSIIEDVAAYIRNACKYDMAYPACPAGEDEVVYFLTESKSGVCRHFASAATLMYRSLGIPARYVVGYSTYAKGGEWTDVKGADAHAWVEVFVAGLGWVRIDPTPAAGDPIGEGTLVLGLSKVMGYYNGVTSFTATEDNVVIVSGTLKPGHTLASVEVLSDVLLDAGFGTSAIGEVEILDADGNNVTSEYTIVKQDGVIEVRKPTLTVTAASAKKQYDGEKLVQNTFTYTFTNAARGIEYTVVAEVIGEQIGVGESYNVIGNVTVTDPLGRDVTKNFDIIRVSGVLKVYLFTLSLESQGYTKVYDGTPLQMPELIFDAQALADRGHRLAYTMPSITDVGAIYNTPEYTILDEAGEDVTEQYDVYVSRSVLRITAIQITLVTNSEQKVFDGRPLRGSGYTWEQGELVLGHSIQSYEITGSQTNVGVSEAELSNVRIVDENGRDVTRNYQIHIKPGTLTVLAP